MFIHLTGNPVNSPVPFKIFNYWQQCSGFQEVLNKAWSSQSQGYPLFRLVNKLKSLKMALKSWRKSDFSSPAAKINGIREEHVRNQLAAQPLDPTLHQEELTLRKELVFWLANEEDQFK